jgi:superfamily II DNA or RNA helicase
VVTPTLDLLHQWLESLALAFDVEIGALGGGSRNIEDITVTTYDSAHLHMEQLGHRFGLLIFDECHHLPSTTYAFSAEASIAPFRLGLTATPERDGDSDGGLHRLLGPQVYRQDVKDLAGRYLADYETVGLRVQLTDQERASYEEHRKTYLGFLRRHRIPLGSPGGWTRFLRATSRNEEGRKAFLAYRKQKAIAQASSAKLRLLEHLLLRHRRDRVLIFTSDNETVYRISRRFLIPAITHQTRVPERREILAGLHSGDYPFVVTSRVLNEGVDVPAANVAIVLSGSGSTREHVQRLGRILRKGEDKRALLYEVVSEDTSEEGVSSRRRRHSAYT